MNSVDQNVGLVSEASDPGSATYYLHDYIHLSLKRASALGSWKGYVKYHSTAVLASGKLTINVIPYFK